VRGPNGLLINYSSKMQVEQQITEIWAILHAIAERENQMEIRFNKRMEAADRKREADQRAMNERMDRAEARMHKAEARMGKMDGQILATYKLVRQGMKMLVELGAAQKEMKQEIRELVKAQKAYLDSMRRGNGNGRRH
jgi:hypothetical protein